MTTEKISDFNAQSKGSWEQVTIGGVAGIVFGVGAATFTNARTAQEEGKTAHAHEALEPEVNEENVPMATCVDDGMTFSQAFSAARLEVGPGGVFEWHGKLYGTFTADEWAKMTAEQRHDFNDNFAWTHQPARSQEPQAEEETLVAQNAEPVADDAPIEAAPAIDANDEVEVLGVVNSEPATTLYVSNQDFVMVEVSDDLDGFTPPIEAVQSLDNGPDYINNAPVEDLLS